MNVHQFEASVRSNVREYADSTDETGTSPNQRRAVASEILRELAEEIENGELR